MEAGNQPSHPSKRPIFLLVIPLASCVLSSIVGVAIAQVGNLFYAAIGDVSVAVCLPAYFVLFLLTAGISFLVSMVLKRLFHKTEG
ncbi:MAG: hypothetical protein HPY59_00255 [Anaerolineae bacterium]|nr:hypothetical protein [Anaerolineae bacterium]